MIRLYEDIKNRIKEKAMKKYKRYNKQSLFHIENKQIFQYGMNKTK